METDDERDQTGTKMPGAIWPDPAKMKFQIDDFNDPYSRHARSESAQKKVDGQIRNKIA